MRTTREKTEEKKIKKDNKETEKNTPKKEILAKITENNTNKSNKKRSMKELHDMMHFTSLQTHGLDDSSSSNSGSEEEEDDDDNEISLLNHSLQLLLKSDEYNTPFRICVANAILTIQKMLLDSSKKKELERLARSCVVDIPRDIAEQNASLFGALLRLNFFACYHSKSAARMNATRLLIVSTISIQASSAPQVRLEGLKLLGVLLSSLESMPSDLPDGLLGKMTATLRSLANMDPDRTCRKLAENLVGLLRC